MKVLLKVLITNTDYYADNKGHNSHIMEVISTVVNGLETSGKSPYIYMCVCVCVCALVFRNALSVSWIGCRDY